MKQATTKPGFTGTPARQLAGFISKFDPAIAKLVRGARPILRKPSFPTAVELVYVIVAMIIRKRALLHVGLCEQHRTIRKRTIIGSWLTVLSGLVIMFVGFSTHGAFALVGLFLILGGAIFGLVRGRVVAPTKIEKDLVWAKGAGPAFLENLPVWSGLR